MSPEIVAAVARRNLSNPECPVNNSHVFALSKRKVEKKRNSKKKRMKKKIKRKEKSGDDTLASRPFRED